MKLEHLINMAWMQILWFAAVLGAAYGFIWPAFILLIIFAAWQLQNKHTKNGDMQLILVSIFIGLILDSCWIQLGWIKFSNPGPIPHLAPLWILILWAGLALTINHSLAWLQNKLFMAGYLSGLICPFSYIAAQRLGALQIISESWNWFFGLALAWGVAIPLLLWLAKHIPLHHTESCDV